MTKETKCLQCGGDGARLGWRCEYCKGTGMVQWLGANEGGYFGLDRSKPISRTSARHPLWRLGDWLCELGRRLGGD